jgi:hypothetical protein
LVASLRSRRLSSRLARCSSSRSAHAPANFVGEKGHGQRNATPRGGSNPLKSRLRKQSQKPLREVPRLRSVAKRRFDSILKLRDQIPPRR